MEVVERSLVDIWQELANDPDMPDRYELNELGEVILSPRPSGRHQLVMSEVAEQLLAQIGGRVLSKMPMMTSAAGIRCPDLVWLPKDREMEAKVEGPLQTVPPLVVEVLSPSNRPAEVANKIRAYLETGVKEVIVVKRDGKVAYLREDGEHTSSDLGVKLNLPGGLFE